MAAALIIADKSDVRRSRVQNDNEENFDAHDKVNYSVKKAELKINENGVYVNDEQKIDFKDIDYTCNFVSNGNDYSHILTKEQLFLTGDNHKNSLDSLRVLCEQGDNNAYLSNLEVMQYGKIIAQT